MEIALNNKYRTQNSIKQKTQQKYYEIPQKMYANESRM